MSDISASCFGGLTAQTPAQNLSAEASWIILGVAVTFVHRDPVTPEWTPSSLKMQSQGYVRAPLCVTASMQVRLLPEV